MREHSSSTGVSAAMMTDRASIKVTPRWTIPMAGRTWRITDFLGKFGPITARYNLAHALPEEKAQATR